MITCATMQSALLRHLSSKYYYRILGMMIMEGMVCFIVLLTQIYGLVNKSSLYLICGVSYNDFIDFMVAILNFSFQRNPLRVTLHRPRYYYGVLSMHNQKSNQLLSAKTRLSP